MAGFRDRYVRTDSAGGNGTANTSGAGGNNAYASLNAALAAEAVNLVTADVVLRIYCGTGAGTGADATLVTVNGAWTTDATRYVAVLPQSGHEFDGVYSATRYRTTAGIKNQTCNNLYFGRVQIQVPSDQSAVRALAHETGLETGNCWLDGTGIIVYHADGGQTVGAAVSLDDGSPTYYLRNVGFIIHASSVHAAVTTILVIGGGTVYAHNCTVRGVAANGFNNTGGTVSIKNCLISGPTSCLTGTITERYTATSDGDGVGTGSRASQTFTFQEINSVRLSESDAGARNFGEDLSGDGNLPVSLDMIGTARPQGAAFDIGCYEVLAAATQYGIVVTALQDTQG